MKEKIIESFNPSQVQFTQDEGVQSFYAYKFQSLTGSIHTRQK